jgi:hypothetical protein
MGISTGRFRRFPAFLENPWIRRNLVFPAGFPFPALSGRF